MTATNVLVTGVSLPICCRSHGATNRFFSSHLLLAQRIRVNSVAELTYVVWKCSSPPASADSTENDDKQNEKTHKVHSQWMPQRCVSIVHPASLDVNNGHPRFSYDSEFKLNNPLVELWRSTSGSMGRFTVSKRFIHTGQQVLQAPTFAVVLKQNLTLRRCHWCFAALRTKALQCGGCTFSRYCSRDCLQNDMPLHDFQCRALKELKIRACTDAMGDLETVRLVVAVLSMEQLVRNPQALGLLVTHRNDSDKKGEVESAVKFIVEMTDRVLQSTHVRTTIERVRSNAHPIYIDGVTCVGSGIFPDAAMALNHSCLPNVAPSFNPQTRTLAFHAIADIPRRHTVECAYIDLLQSRERRQSLLAHAFGFICVCLRCTNEAAVPSLNQDKATSEKSGYEETRVMKELMELVNLTHHEGKNRLSYLRKKYMDIFELNSEARFALYTSEMQLARNECDWNRVIETAEVLLEIWTRCGLPDNYHITETLQMQIYVASKHANMTQKAKLSAQRVIQIRQICGYSHPENFQG